VPELSILVVGSTERSEFRDALDALSGRGSVVAVADPVAAAALLASGEPAVDLIVIAQSHPGEFSAEAVDRLRGLAPLARIVALLGSWCEGETRTGRPWPGVIRVYWHQWPARAGQELERLRSGVRSSWALPSTASEEERLLAFADEPWPKREGLIAIVSRGFESQDWLAAACRRIGCQTVWLCPPALSVPGQVAAILFDATDAKGEELRQLQSLADSNPPTPILVLMDFPRAEDRDRVLAAGARAVLSKPLLVEDLLWHLDQVFPADRPRVDVRQAGAVGGFKPPGAV
jgi:DNA-binding NarL/FixJ family response regulator